MNNFTKYLKLLRTIFTFVFLFLTTALPASGIDEVQAQKLGNFLDNAFANMNDEEKELFMQEVQREQEKLMAMSPEERAAREEQVARELDQLMNNSPYVEWFENPATLPSATPSPDEPLPSPKEPVVKKTTTNKPKANTVVISKDTKGQFKQTIQNIVQAIDSILLKTTSMQQIQHSSWNHGKWLRLDHDLQALKSELQMMVNNDTTLGDFLSSEQTALRADLITFEKILVQNANKLKTPDSMGLVVVFEGRPKIIDQARYNEAILKLKNIIDALSTQLESTNLVSKINSLMVKHTPTENQNVIDSKKLATQKKEPARPTNKNSCKQSKTLDETLKQVNLLLQEIKNCANAQLLELAITFQKNSASLVQRKLKWKLSELELHLGRLAKTVDSMPSCKKDLLKIIHSEPFNNDVLHQIIAILNNTVVNHELNVLIKQIDAHIKNLEF